MPGRRPHVPDKDAHTSSLSCTMPPSAMPTPTFACVHPCVHPSMHACMHACASHWQQKYKLSRGIMPSPASTMAPQTSLGNDHASYAGVLSAK
eukprot:365151-Chlamydomonas_euryale.AAC.13